MKRNRLLWNMGTAVIAALIGAGGVLADAPDAEEIMKGAHLNLFYAGDGGRAQVHMELIDKRGKSRSRDFVMIRLDIEDGGEQRYYTYFTGPGDVRRTSFMVWKDPAKDDSRWIYVPALDLVKRISANDKASSFVGSDFSYEDVSGRHWSNDTHTLQSEEVLDGEEAYVVESIPNEKDVFSKKTTWVSKSRSIPLREEYFDNKGKLYKIFRAETIEEIDGILTVTRRSMENVKKNHTTVVEFSDVTYGLGVEADLFTERYLKAPPKSVTGS